MSDTTNTKTPAIEAQNARLRAALSRFVPNGSRCTKPRPCSINYPGKCRHCEAVFVLAEEVLS